MALTFWEELAKIAVDRVLLGFAGVAIGYFVAKQLERDKADITIRTENVRMRVQAVNEVFSLLLELRGAYDAYDDQLRGIDAQSDPLRSAGVIKQELERALAMKQWLMGDEFSDAARGCYSSLRSVEHDLENDKPAADENLEGMLLAFVDLEKSVPDFARVDPPTSPRRSWFRSRPQR